MCVPQIKMLVILGELGGADEYGVVEALKPREGGLRAGTEEVQR